MQDWKTLNRWTSIYVAQTIRETVTRLRVLGYTVRYDPHSSHNRTDPEHDNAYLPDHLGLVSSCVRWRRNPDKAAIAHIPEGAMACIQLRMPHPDFERLRALIAAQLDVLPHQDGPRPLWATDEP